VLAVATIVGFARFGGGPASGSPEECLKNIIKLICWTA